MESFLITNLCTKVRVKTKDEQILQLFSGFYKHPAMINEEGWHLQKHGNVNILVDEDTMHIMKSMVCEFGFEANSDTILTCKLTSTIKDKDERMKQWNELYEYASDVRKAAAEYFDQRKIYDLTKLVKDVSLKDDDAKKTNSEDAEKLPSTCENTSEGSDATPPKT